MGLWSGHIPFFPSENELGKVCIHAKYLTAGSGRDYCNTYIYIYIESM